jgi:hypothetical protein
MLTLLAMTHSKSSASKITWVDLKKKKPARKEILSIMPP